jgi:hypothetical protein
MEHRGRKPVLTRFMKQVGFDGSFLGAVFAKGASRLIFRRRNLSAVTVYPDGAAVKEVLHAPPQRLDKLAVAGFGETNQVDYDVGLEIADSRRKCARLILALTIRNHLLDSFPCSIGQVGLALPSRDVDDLVPFFDQHRDEISADVPAASDDDDSHGCFLIWS